MDIMTLESLIYVSPHTCTCYCFPLSLPPSSFTHQYYPSCSSSLSVISSTLSSTTSVRASLTSCPPRVPDQLFLTCMHLLETGLHHYGVEVRILCLESIEGVASCEARLEELQSSQTLSDILEHFLKVYIHTYIYRTWTIIQTSLGLPSVVVEYRKAACVCVCGGRSVRGVLFSAVHKYIGNLGHTQKALCLWLCTVCAHRVTMCSSSMVQLDVSRYGNCYKNCFDGQFLFPCFRL